MMLHVSKTLALPPEAVTEVVGILGTRGSGKSHTSFVMIEEMVEKGLPVVMLDPLGVGWGLRLAADGVGDGLPIAILGGRHGDLPLAPEQGELIARVVVEQRLPLVLDLSRMSKNGQKRFVTAFAETVYQLQQDVRLPLHIVIDEADLYAPQQPNPGEQQMIGAIDDIVRRGRAAGLGVTMITQRPAAIAKNVLSMCEMLIVHRVIGPNDRKAVDGWVKDNISEAQRDELLGSLASLEKGEAWVSSAAWLKMFERVQIRPRWTFDSSRTPTVGATITEPQAWSSIDVDRLRDLLQTDQVETTGPAADHALHQRIADLERQLAESIAKRIVERVEVPVITADIAARIEALADEWTKMGEGVLKALRGASLASPVIPQPSASPASDVDADAEEDAPDDDEAKIKRGAYRMLQMLAVASFPLTRSQLGVLTGFVSSGGTFGNYIRALRSNGFVQTTDGAVSITDAGREYLGDDLLEALPTKSDLAEMWGGRLKLGARNMLTILIDSYPGWLTKQELGDQAGFEASGGTFGNYFRALRRFELIRSANDRVSASPDLFVGEG